ncbi:pirin protein [Reticulomyxa filosa]|uniref:Pirin protein n=1 Tax=Reticulomyxa filosa TaxID=46433 RepID=X6N8H9_RETFI|nr:pirin protein [Reticulomyxa filosa]|eukprot:ETO22049.1 pirin protein [Reticulomyxa filosa]
MTSITEKEKVEIAQEENKEAKEKSTGSPSKPVNKVILKSFAAHTQREGAGFIVNRPIGFSRNLSDKEADPFLLLDELGYVLHCKKKKDPKHYEKGEFEGAPWHPHRGFDTVMYLKDRVIMKTIIKKFLKNRGYGTHQDSMYVKETSFVSFFFFFVYLFMIGTLGPGDCQWMTAGKGIIHDEGRDHPGGMLHGFQLWVNLPKSQKMCDPKYQTITAKNFAFVEVNKGVKVKAIAGSVSNMSGNDKALVTSPIKPIQPINYFDYSLEPNSSFVHTISQAEELTTVIVYVYNGKGHFADGGISGSDSETDKEKKWVSVSRKQTLYLGKGDSIEFKSAEKEKLEFLLLVGKPTKEVGFFATFA